MTVWERIKGSKEYIIDLLSDLSTWRGIMFFVSMVVSKFGYQLSDMDSLYISTALAYLIGILFKDNYLKNKVGK